MHCISPGINTLGWFSGKVYPCSFPLADGESSIPTSPVPEGQGYRYLHGTVWAMGSLACLEALPGGVGQGRAQGSEQGKQQRAALSGCLQHWLRLLILMQIPW